MSSKTSRTKQPQQPDHPGHTGEGVYCGPFRPEQSPESEQLRKALGEIADLARAAAVAMWDGYRSEAVEDDYARLVILARALPARLPETPVTAWIAARAETMARALAAKMTGNACPQREAVRAQYRALRELVASWPDNLDELLHLEAGPKPPVVAR